MPRLMQVKGNGYALHWPDSFPQDARLRGMKGVVIDADHPLEKGYDELLVNAQTGNPELDPMSGAQLKRHIVGWCEGQMHKLEDAPADAVVTPLTHPTAIRVRAAWEEKYLPKDEVLAGAGADQPPQETYSRRKPRRNFREIEG